MIRHRRGLVHREGCAKEREVESVFPADPRLRQAVDNRPALKKAGADDPVGVPSNTFSGAQSKAVARASIRFPPDLHKTLEEIAQQKKVLFAWVVA